MYRGYLPAKSDAEQQLLEQRILAEGCLSPLVVGSLLGTRCLIDGFHRRAICEKYGRPFGVTELAFVSEDALLSWIETQPHRDRTRTTRNYFIGRRYTREKKDLGENQHSEGGKKVPTLKSRWDSTAERIASEESCSHQHGKNGIGKKVPDSNTTALRIAAEESCSDRHVKTCEKMSLAIDAACKTGSGMEWVRDLILTERIKYSKVMLDELVFRGAGGCREQVEGAVLVAKGKPVSAIKVREAIGTVDEPGDAYRPPAPTPCPARACGVSRRAASAQARPTRRSARGRWCKALRGKGVGRRGRQRGLGADPGCGTRSPVTFPRCLQPATRSGR